MTKPTGTTSAVWDEAARELEHSPWNDGWSLNERAAIIQKACFAYLSQESPRRFLVDVDSVLSLIVHRFGSSLPEEIKSQATKLYLEARASYQSKDKWGNAYMPK